MLSPYVVLVMPRPVAPDGEQQESQDDGSADNCLLTDTDAKDGEDV
jgi:hypothetical protein